MRALLRIRRWGLLAGAVGGLLLAVASGGPVAAQDGPGDRPGEQTTDDEASAAAEEARRQAEAAQQRLDEILRRQRELQSRLDRAVINFEGRRGQLGRLDQAQTLARGELGRVRDRAAATARARDDFVRSLYKRPASALYTWAISEGDIGDAIHRGLMVGYVLDAGAATLERAERVSTELIDRAADVDRLRDSAEQAVERLALAQEELGGLLEEIGALERSARQLVATTTARAEELEEAARRRGSGARRCPIGSPNSFVDTWGAPRSGGRRHQGVDVFAPGGTELYAVADGVIDRADTLSLGGITLHLEAEDGDRYYYAHLSGYAAGIAAGVRVSAGELVGYVGRTGNARSTPPHLHWEHHPVGAGPVNPTPLARELCR